jgi:hypothetical protein
MERQHTHEDPLSGAESEEETFSVDAESEHAGASAPLIMRVPSSENDDPSEALLAPHHDGNRGTLPRGRKTGGEHKKVAFSVREAHAQEEDDVPLYQLLWQDAKRFSFAALWRSIAQGLLFWALDFWVSLRYVSVDSLKNKKNFCIAVITIIIAVAAIVSLTAIVAKSPLVFVKLAENTVGEYDLLITPDGTPISVEPQSYDRNTRFGRTTNGSSPINMLEG